jgi:non-heme chloroperoxidase
MGAAEAVRMIARHGGDRLTRLVLVAPTTPRLLRASDNPEGLPPGAFEEMVTGLKADKPAFLATFASAFFGAPEAVSSELTGWGVRLAERASVRTSIELVRTFSQADLRDDLSAVSVPTLILHGDADVPAPLELCGRPTAEGIRGSRLEVYEGGPHGLPLATGHKERLTRDLMTCLGVDTRDRDRAP